MLHAISDTTCVTRDLDLARCLKAARQKASCRAEDPLNSNLNQLVLFTCGTLLFDVG
jgi:hypothetical protein